MTDLFNKPTVDRRGHTRVIGLGDNAMEQIEEDEMESARVRAETTQEVTKPLDEIPVDSAQVEEPKVEE